MTTIINGSSPSITFSDSTTQTTEFTSTPSVTTITTSSDASISGLTVGKGGGSVATNTAVGSTALASNTSGAYNNAFGLGALYTNSTGVSNIAVGWYSLYNNTGSNNVAIGHAAGYANSTGSYNTVVGHQSLNSSTNTGSNLSGFGYKALYSNTTGNNNTAIGNEALSANTTASYNTAVGYQSLYTNTTGQYITALGYQAGYSGSTTVENTFIGYQAGYGSTGSYGVMVGHRAGYNLTTGARNTLVGYGAGTSLTTGGYNTFIGPVTDSGTGAGGSVSTGSKNTILGGYNGNQGGLDIRTASNYIVLSDGDGNPRGVFDNNGNLLVGVTSTSSPGDGNSTTGIGLRADGTILASKAGNTALLGNTNGSGNRLCTWNYQGTTKGSIDLNGTTGVTYNTTSDYRLKHDVAPMTGALSKVAQLKPVTYKWNADDSDGEGFIAHELAEVCPHAVTGAKDAVDEGGKPVYQGIDTSFLVATLTAAIQELKALVDAQATEIAELKAKVV